MIVIYLYSMYSQDEEMSNPLARGLSSVQGSVPVVYIVSLHPIAERALGPNPERAPRHMAIMV